MVYVFLVLLRLGFGSRGNHACRDVGNAVFSIDSAEPEAKKLPVEPLASTVHPRRCALGSGGPSFFQGQFPASTQMGPVALSQQVGLLSMYRLQISVQGQVSQGAAGAKFRQLP